MHWQEILSMMYKRTQRICKQQKMLEKDWKVWTVLISRNCSFTLNLPINFYGQPTPSVSVAASIATSIGIHCDTWEWRGDRFPSVTQAAVRRRCCRWRWRSVCLRPYTIKCFNCEVKLNLFHRENCHAALSFFEYDLLEFSLLRHFDSFLMETNYFCLFRCNFWISVAWFTQYGRQNTKPLIFTKDWIISQLKVDLWTCNFTVILFLGKWIHGVIYLCEVDFDMCTMYVMAAIGSYW